MDSKVQPVPDTPLNEHASEAEAIPNRAGLEARARGHGGIGAAGSASAAVEFLRRYVLPNGMEIAYQSRAEVEFFYKDIFEKEIYLKHGVTLSDGDCVFDVGANIGLFTLFANQRCMDVKVYAFEPAPPLFEILRYNVSRYAVDAKLFNCGLSNAERTTPFTFYPNSSGMSSFYADRREEKEALRGIMANQLRQGMSGMKRVMRYADELLEERLKSETYNCRVRTASEIIRAEHLERIDLMKIDVQKSELDVLAGICEGDWPKIKQIVIEVHDIGGRLRQVMDLLVARGYQVAVEQDDHYQHSILYNLFARRTDPLPDPALGGAITTAALTQIHDRATKQKETTRRRKQMLEQRNKRQ
jgi:FkbM family methyltransferase